MKDPNPVENIDRLGDLMFQSSDKSQLLWRVLWINAKSTIVWSLKHKISQPVYIFNRENYRNSESPNGPRRGLDFIALFSFELLIFPKDALDTVYVKTDDDNYGKLVSTCLNQAII